MDQPFFPIHIAGEIVLLNVLTALAFLIILAGAPGSTTARTFSHGPWVRLGLILAGWYTLVHAFAASGWISIEPWLFGVMPTLIPAIVLPSAAGMLLLLSARFRASLDRVSLGWLAAFHGLRSEPRIQSRLRVTDEAANLHKVRTAPRLRPLFQRAWGDVEISCHIFSPQQRVVIVVHETSSNISTRMPRCASVGLYQPSVPSLKLQSNGGSSPRSTRRSMVLT